MIVAREKSPSMPEIQSKGRAVAAASSVVRPKVLSPPESQKGHEEAPAQSVELLNELGLRNYVSNLANSGLPIRSTLLTAPTAVPEVASSLPELFWKLVERRVHAVTFAYTDAGRLREDVIRVTPHGYSLVRA